MINKDLIELQKGCKATCAIILDEDYKELKKSAIVNAKISYSELNKIVKDNISVNNDLEYFIVKEIDEINFNEQEKFISLIKDRIIFNTRISDNIIIILTVENKENIKKISNELYSFCVVAF